MSKSSLSMPLAFEMNEGQLKDTVKFIARGVDSDVYFASNEIILSLENAAKIYTTESSSAVIAGEGKGGGLLKPADTHAAKSRDVVRMCFGSTAKRISGVNELSGTVNYFIGKNPKNWHTNIKTYRRVKYQEIYPGIDQIFYGNGEHLEYDFVVSPGANPRAIRFRFTGQIDLSIDGAGDLVMHAASSQEIRLHKPIAYEEIDGAKRLIPVQYVMKRNHEIGFEIGEYDRTRQLVIDPVLSYSSYLGGSGNDAGFDIAVDSSGSAYVTGSTDSNEFSSLGGTNAFVAKLSPDGTQRTYLAILGGASDDTAFSITVDSTGAAYVTGATNSLDFPLTNALQSSFGGGSQDAFIAKLDAAGSSLVYSTYFGGTGNDTGFGIAVDSAGSAYVTGSTDSPELSTLGNTDAYVTKLSPSANTRMYFSVLGGMGDDTPFDIAVDGAGSAYIVGSTDSADFTTVNALQPNYGGAQDAFVAKLGPSGAVAYSSYFGGNGTDSGFGIAVDSAGNAYITGSTNSPELTNPDSRDVFVAKFSAAGDQRLYLNIFGGSGDDAGFAIAVDSGGNVYVTGSTGSSNFTTANGLQSTLGGSQDVFVAKLNSLGSTLDYSTYIGNDGNQAGFAMAVDAAGSAYVTGFTNSTTFPIASPYQSLRAGSGDAFLLKLGAASTVSVTTSVGTNVRVQGSGVLLTFQTVAVTGSTSIAVATTNSLGGLPPGFQVFADSILFNVSTTATVQGSIGVCFNGNSNADSATFSRLRIVHNENGVWINRTTSSDFATRTLCSTVTSIGQFAVVLLGPPTALNDLSSNRAAVLNSVTLTRDPISLIDTHNFSSDQRARLTLFVQGVDLLAAESVSLVTAQARDSQNITYPLTVEAVAKVPNLEWLNQVIVKLPDSLIGKGDVQISVTVRGIQSQPVIVRIQ